MTSQYVVYQCRNQGSGVSCTVHNLRGLDHKLKAASLEAVVMSGNSSSFSKLWIEKPAQPRGGSRIGQQFQEKAGQMQRVGHLKFCFMSPTSTSTSTSTLPIVVNFYIKSQLTVTILSTAMLTRSDSGKLETLLLQCFDVVGWTTGRASDQ